MIPTRTALFVGAAAVGATLGVVGIAQATSANSGGNSGGSSGAKAAAPAQSAIPSSSTPGADRRHHGKRTDGARGPGRLGDLGDLGETLHGEFTVARDKQAPRTVDVQRGAVLTVAGQTVTVRSTDGYVGVYTTNRDTKVSKDETSAGTSTLAAGQAVGVLAERTGDTRTALRIRIRTR